MRQHKGLNVLLSTEKQQHCSRVFVAFCLHNLPNHFLQPCRGSEGAHPTTEVFLEGIGLCQIFRCPVLPSCDTSCCRYNSQAPCHSCSQLCALTHSANRLFCVFLLFLSVEDVPFFLYLSSCSFFFCWIFSSPASIPLGLAFFFFFWCWEMRGARIFFHCWLSTALKKAQASCHLLLLALIVPTDSDLHMGIWLFTLWAQSPHQSGKILSVPSPCALPFSGSLDDHKWNFEKVWMNNAFLVQFPISDTVGGEWERKF